MYTFLLTDERTKIYKIKDGEFFIKSDGTGTKSFKVFQDESLQWKTDAPPLLVDQDIIEVVGNCIDSRYEK
jgi:hypothetical protein